MFRMLKWLHCCLLLALPILIHAQPAGWVWGRSTTCSPTGGGSEGWLVRPDNTNGVFAAGYFYGSSVCVGSLTFPNPFNSNNNTQSLFIKYDTTGNLQWAAASINGQSRPIAIATSQQGDLIVFGLFTSPTITFGGRVVQNLGYDTSLDENHGYYLLKYSSSGVLLWANGCNGNLVPAADRLHPGGVGIDSGGNIYITGMYLSSQLQSGSDTFHNAGADSTTDIFVASYTSQGAYRWGRSFGGLKDDYVADLSAGVSHIALTGSFKSGYIDFGSSRLYSSTEKAWVAVLDTNGLVTWATSADGTSSTRAIAIHKDGSVSVAGGFANSVSFGERLFSNAAGGYYYYTFDRFGNVIGGNTLNFSQTIPSCCQAFGLASDDCGNVWLSANLDRNATLSTGGNVISAPAGSIDPMFIAGFDSSGNLEGSVALQSGAGYNTGLSNTGISMGADHRLYLCGDFRLKDPFVFGTDSLHPSGQSSLFVACYATGLVCDTPSVDTTTYPAIPVITITPNPAALQCVLNYNGSLGNGPAYGALRDAAGRLLRIFTLTGHMTVIPLDELADGVYMCTLQVDKQPLYTLRLVVLKS